MRTHKEISDVITWPLLRCQAYRHGSSKRAFRANVDHWADMPGRATVAMPEPFYQMFVFIEM